MSQRVLRTRVRVTGDDGLSVVLRAGDTVPEKYEAQITNPRCYVDTTSLEQPAEPVVPTPPAAPEPDGDPADEDEDETGSDKPEDGQEPDEEPEEQDEPADEAPVAYSDLTVAELEDLLAERGLPQSGVKRELIARLKADDAK